MVGGGWLAALLLAGTGADEGAFRESLAAARMLLADGEHEEGYAALRALLEENAGERYVLAELVGIQEDLMLALFRAEYEAPEPEDVVTGELLLWRERKGDIRIRYTDPSQLGDFVREKDTLAHPLTFEGNYQVEVEYEEYLSGKSGQPPGVVVGIRGLRPLVVSFGRAKRNDSWGNISWYPAVLALYDGRARKKLDSTERGLPERGERTELTVRVKANSAAAYANGRKLVSARAGEDLHGGVAILNFDDESKWTRIELQGTAQTSWIQGLLDRHATEAWEAFERTFYLPDHLPEPVLAALEGRDDAGGWRVELTAEEEAAAGPVLSLFAEGMHDVGLERIEGLEGVVPATRELLRTIALVELGSLDEAQAACRRLGELAPGLREQRLLSAFLSRELGRTEEAVALLEALHAEEPVEPRAAEMLAELELFRGNRARAAQVVRAAVLAGASPVPLGRVQRMLVWSERGPAWPVVREHRTKNYLIRTDLDERTAMAAGRELEAAHQRYQRHLEYLPRTDDPYAVYLFSGHAGFQRYVDLLVGQEPENVAGLYSPWLKQLVVWNLPDEQDLWTTVRHEAFHQYFDRLVGKSPTWLNEGLAEYYETMKLVRGRWVHDEPHEANLRIARGNLVPLEGFVLQSPGRFYARESHRAQAWAFVHFLLHGPSEGKRHFDALIRALQDGTAPGEAVEQAFDGVEWTLLHLQFMEYVFGL